MYKTQERRFGLNTIRQALTYIGVQFLNAEDQRVVDSTRLDKKWGRHALSVTFDDGTSVAGRDNSCMMLGSFNEKILLVREPLGSGKSYQARQLRYKRVC